MRKTFLTLAALLSGISLVLGVYLVVRWIPLNPDHFHRIIRWNQGQILLFQPYLMIDWGADYRNSGPVVPSDFAETFHCAGIYYWSWAHLSRSRLTFAHAWVVTVLTVGASVFPLSLLPAWRRRKLLKSGLCPSCGYDLRATMGRCPECGAASTPGK